MLDLDHLAGFGDEQNIQRNQCVLHPHMHSSPTFEIKHHTGAGREVLPFHESSSARMRVSGELYVQPNCYTIAALHDELAHGARGGNGPNLNHQDPAHHSWSAPAQTPRIERSDVPRGRAAIPECAVGIYSTTL